MDERKAVDIIYLDFSKAFNTISHRHSSGETDCSWAGWAYALVDKELST